MKKEIERANAALEKVKAGIPEHLQGGLIADDAEFMVHPGQYTVYSAYIDAFARLTVHKKEIEMSDDEQLVKLIKLRLFNELWKIIENCKELREAIVKC